jgi:hypothetical protein
MFSHLAHRVTCCARWILLSCGCQVTLHGNAKAPTYCPDCRKTVTSSAS